MIGIFRLICLSMKTHTSAVHHRVAGCLVALAMGLVPATAITFTNDTLITFGDTNYDGADIVLSNCTVTMDGPHSFASLHVLNGGKLTHTGIPSGVYQPTFSVTNEQHLLIGTNPVTLALSTVVQSSILVQDFDGLITYTNGADYLVGVDSNGLTTVQRTDISFIPDGSTNRFSYDAVGQAFLSGLNISVTNEIVIEPGGSIIADGLGYGFTYGLGRGNMAGSPASGWGGGHGGFGGLSASNALGGNVYGSILQPTDKGSGGGYGYAGAGGFGGGAIRLFAGGLVQIGGIISARGANGLNERSGGGSGGSVWISAQTISGAGSMFADGGAGEPSQGGGGGGGRIALYFDTNVFSGIISARGGNGSMVGGAGTIYKRATGQISDLVLDNTGRRGTNTLVPPTEAFNVTIKSGAVMSFSGSGTLSSLLVASNAAVSLVNNSLTITGNVTVDVGGLISADGNGFASGVGVGAGRNLTGTNSGGGAGYGGFGSSSVLGAAGGVAYGSLSQPAELGSGGGVGTGVTPYSAGGSGGGVVRMTVNGNLL
jgi:hypothetical protein